MFSIQAMIELFVAVAGGLMLLGQLKNTTEANKKGLEALKGDLVALMEKNNVAIQEGLNTFKDHQRENLEREITHLKDLMAASSRETREDIKELRRAQEASNRIKERLALAEASIRSLHKRLDLEPPVELPE